MNPSKLLALLAAAATLFCATVPQRASASPMNGAQPAYTGKQYFEGVFFGVGPVAKMLPQFWGGRFSKNGTAQNIRGLHYLEAGISRRDPAYFSAVRAEFTSGDPGLVSRAIARTHADIQAVAHTSVSRSKVVGYAPDMVNVNTAVNYNYTVNVTAAANVAVVVLAVAAVLVLVVVLDQPEPMMTAFQRERLVANLARTLRAPV